MDGRASRGGTSSVEYNINACELGKSHPMGALLTLTVAEGLVQLTRVDAGESMRGGPSPRYDKGQSFLLL